MPQNPPCPPTHILNPATGFCVSRTGAIGKKLLKDPLPKRSPSANAKKTPSRRHISWAVLPPKHVATRPPPKKMGSMRPVGNIVEHVAKEHALSVAKSQKMHALYDRNLASVHPQFHDLYPSYVVWTAFRKHGFARGDNYRTTNVEDYIFDHADFRRSLGRGWSLKRGGRNA